jgi:hypothetical protein
VLVEDGKGESGNPWGVKFTRLFDMSTDSGLFQTAAQLFSAGGVRSGSDWEIVSNATGIKPGRYVPLYESKMVHQFDHRFGYYPDGETNDTRALPRPSLIQKQDPNYDVAPRYWVLSIEVEQRLADKNWQKAWLIGWRDITNSTNERTVISGISPIVGFGDKFLLMFPAAIDKAVALVGALNSLTLDYCARQKLVGTSFKYFLMKQLPVPPPMSFISPDLAFIVPRIVELTYTSHSVAAFARDLGYEGLPFTWDDDRRAWLGAELDAYYARIYGLTRGELQYILDPTFVKGQNYPSETFRVLRKNEEAKYGEYRTARLVMQAWDELAAKEKVA